jgi:hypothetical protein
VVTAIKKDELDVDWRFLAFSLDQAHTEEGASPVWERPPLERGTGVLSLQWGLAIRDTFSDRFFEFHLAMFAARFDDGLKIGKEEVVRDVAASVGLDVDAVAEEVGSGRPLETLAAEHTEAVERWAMFGVPTFCEGDEAVFVRFMERDRVDDLERMLDLLSWDRLNEFKHTKIAR